MGLPGALPVLNRHAVALATRAALAFGCRINETSVFARKNYFYPDLPKGYQISQYDRPLAEGGSIALELDADRKTIRIERVHMEEDAGKLLHEGFADAASKSGVDFNRSGVPLIEIVTHPDLRTPREAADFFARLRAILVAIGVNDGNMEEGSLRCDANVSVRPAGESALGVKVEVKNINSFRFLQRALEHELVRQTELLRAGGHVVQETRLWDEAVGRTVSMRSKEEAHDYRYFPEPDLPPVEVSDSWIDEVRADRLIPQTGLLNHAATGFDELDLAVDLERERLREKSKRVEVFDFDFGAELARASRPYRHVTVETEISLLHVGVRGLGVLDNLFERFGVTGGFVRARHVGLADDLDERLSSTPAS